jgi:hypothetical protein
VAGDPDTLRAWALAWDDGDGNADLFRPELLDDPATFVLAGQTPGGRVIAGAVASRSDHAVGISNVFALDGGIAQALPARPHTGRAISGPAGFRTSWPASACRGEEWATVVT